MRDGIGARYEDGADTRANLNIVVRAPGLAARVPHGPAVHYWVLDPTQPGLVGRLDLKDTWWCIAQGVDATVEHVDPVAIVRNLVGAELDPEILALDPWRARMLLANRYRSRRLFIAGDAAHQNPPWGGHCFNTGRPDRPGRPDGPNRPDGPDRERGTASVGSPGSRLPHRWLGPGGYLYDHLGPEFTLVGDVEGALGRRLADAAAKLGVPLGKLALDERDRGRLLGADLALVRPDQHVAWRSRGCLEPDTVLGRAIGG